MNQQVVKKSKKQWVLNPNGKSMVSILMFSFIVTKIGTFLNMFFFFKVKHANLFYAFFMGEGTRLGIIISDPSSWLQSWWDCDLVIGVSLISLINWIVWNFETEFEKYDIIFIYKNTEQSLKLNMLYCILGMYSPRVCSAKFKVLS